MHVDNHWLPEHLHDQTWYPVYHVSWLVPGSIVFDHTGPYYGEVVDLIPDNGGVRVRWYKAPGNDFVWSHRDTLEIMSWSWIDLDPASKILNCPCGGCYHVQSCWE